MPCSSRQQKHNPRPALLVTFRWQAASKLAKRLGLFSKGSVKSQAQRKQRNSFIGNSVRKVSSHLHRHRHSKSLMASYLRMQAAAAPAGPESRGREGQTAGQKDRQYTGHDQGQLERQHGGQAKRLVDRQDGGPDTGTCCCNKATTCSVDMQSVQVSGYSHTLKASGLVAVDSELLHGGQSQPASRYCIAKVSESDLLSRNWPVRPNQM